MTSEQIEYQETPLPYDPDVPIVDFHTHIWTDAFAPRAEAILTSRDNSRAYNPGTVDGLVHSMDLAGIAASVGMAVATKPSQVNTNNDFLSQPVGHKRIAPFAAIHPDLPDPAAVIRRAARAGMRGVKLHPMDQRFKPQEKRLRPLIDAAIQEGMVILFHAGSGFADGCPYGSTDDFARFFDHYNTYGRFVLAHMGGPQGRGTKPVLDPQWPCHFDTAYLMGNFAPDELVDAIHLVGAKRVLFGTDAPWHDQKTDLKLFLKLGLTPEENKAILSSNALDLLRLIPEAIGFVNRVPAEPDQELTSGYTLL